MITYALKKFFGNRHNREVKRLRPAVERINRLEEDLQKLSDDQLRAKTDEFKGRIAAGETTDDLMEEAFAVVKNACRRMCGTQVEVTGNPIEWDMIPYDVQLIGGIALHRGGIAEMQTGEGKTLVGVMPLYLNALTGRNCQLVTVNDYLALRDSQWVGAVLKWLGLTVGVIQHDMSPSQRREMYGCDVTYGTNSEFGFDYLRDMGMATNVESLVQRDHFFCIVDEIDSILIDEARTPLIISGPVPVSTHQYDKLKPDVEQLFRKQNRLCTQLMAEARPVLEDEDADPEDYEEALEKAVRVKLGMPKHRQYLRLVENPTIRRHIEKKEMEVSSDQNRGMLQLFKDTMFFSIDEKHHDADLSEMGRQTLRPADPDAFVLPDLATQFADIEALDIPPAEKVERRNKMQEDYDRQSETMHNISQLLKAYCLFAKDQHYMVVENKVIIVDENTGRAMPGRRFSDGLHQALEAKENVAIERETQTLATVTIQNYFRMYEKLAGMTGTAETEANEFSDIYKLNVLVVPTNRPCLRIDHNDRIFKTKREKYRAIVEEVRECHERGQPVLLGTISVEDSEVLSRLLKREKVPHNVLNAKQHMREAEIVADAGQRGSVTIATNMAGRGTDIRLGQGVKDIGGLHVIGSARHDSRRIDRQLRGRCSRQGDPGSSRFYISLEDDLMRLFGSDRIAKFMERFGFEEGEELSHPWLNRSIETAQRRVEEQHFSVRKRVLEYDDVMNKQREVVYGRRKDVLYSDDPRTLLFDYIDTTVFDQLNSCVYERAEEGEAFDVDHFHNWLSTTFPIGFSREEVAGDTQMFEPEPLVNMIIDRINETYTIKESGEEPEQLRWLERQIMLSAHDELWQEHLYTMDSLRTSIGLMQFAQRDPLVEYKSEAYRIFGTLLLNVNSRICSNVFRSATSLTAFQNMLSSLPKQEVHRMFGQFDTVEDEPAQAEEPAEKPKGVTYQREQPKVGRNDPCPCGSEKKYKHCHGR